MNREIVASIVGYLVLGVMLDWFGAKGIVAALVIGFWVGLTIGPGSPWRNARTPK